MLQALILSMLLLLSACSVNVTGDGVLRTQKYKEKGFQGLIVNGNFQVNIEPGKDTSLEISTDNNLFDYIRVAKKGHILSISPGDRATLNTQHGVTVNIKMPKLKFIRTKGQTELTVKEIIADELTIQAFENSRVLLGGELKHMKLRAENDAFVDGRYLITDSARILAMNNSQIKVKAIKTVVVGAGGSARVELYGRPKKLYKKVKGNAVIEVITAAEPEYRSDDAA